MAANITHGMSIPEVEALSSQLQQASQEIQNLVRSLGSRVQLASWVGPDATQFKQGLWPQHQQQLTQIAHSLAEFGQRAKRNAAEQQNTSAR